MASTGVEVAEETVLVDEAETEAVITGGSFVSLLLDVDCDFRSSALWLGDSEAVLNGTVGGVPVRSTAEGGLEGDDSAGGSCTRGAFVSVILGRLAVEPSRRFQKEENKPDLFLVSAGAGVSSFFSTMRHPTGMSSGTSSVRFLTAISQSDDNPLVRMKCAIGLSRVIAECLVSRRDLFISFAIAELAYGTLGAKVYSGRSVSMRILLEDHHGLTLEFNRKGMPRTGLRRYQNCVANSEATPLEVAKRSMVLLATSSRRTVQRFR